MFGQAAGTITDERIRGVRYPLDRARPDDIIPGMFMHLVATYVATPRALYKYGWSIGFRDESNYIWPLPENVATDMVFIVNSENLENGFPTIYWLWAHEQYMREDKLFKCRMMPFNTYKDMVEYHNNHGREWHVTFNIGLPARPHMLFPQISESESYAIYSHYKPRWITSASLEHMQTEQNRAKAIFNSDITYREGILAPGPYGVNSQRLREYNDEWYEASDLAMPMSEFFANPKVMFPQALSGDKPVGQAAGKMTAMRLRNHRWTLMSPRPDDIIPGMFMSLGAAYVANPEGLYQHGFSILFRDENDNIWALPENIAPEMTFIVDYKNLENGFPVVYWYWNRQSDLVRDDNPKIYKCHMLPFESYEDMSQHLAGTLNTGVLSVWFNVGLPRNPRTIFPQLTEQEAREIYNDYKPHYKTDYSLGQEEEWRRVMNKKVQEDAGYLLTTAPFGIDSYKFESTHSADGKVGAWANTDLREEEISDALMRRMQRMGTAGGTYTKVPLNHRRRVYGNAAGVMEKLRTMGKGVKKFATDVTDKVGDFVSEHKGKLTAAAIGAIVTAAAIVLYKNNPDMAQKVKDYLPIIVNKIKDTIGGKLSAIKNSETAQMMISSLVPGVLAGAIEQFQNPKEIEGWETNPLPMDDIPTSAPAKPAVRVYKLLKDKNFMTNPLAGRPSSAPDNLQFSPNVYATNPIARLANVGTPEYDAEAVELFNSALNQKLVFALAEETASGFNVYVGWPLNNEYVLMPYIEDVSIALDKWKAGSEGRAKLSGGPFDLASYNSTIIPLEYITSGRLNVLERQLLKHKDSALYTQAWFPDPNAPIRLGNSSGIIRRVICNAKKAKKASHY